MQKNMFLFHASDAVDADFGEFQSAKNAEFDSVKELCRQRVFTVQSTGISYRIINHWSKEGLLPEGVGGNEGKWKKFSFIEIVWLEVVKQLRDYGLSLESIKRIKDTSILWDEKRETYPRFEYFIVHAVSSPLDPYLVTTHEGLSAFAFSYQIEDNKSMFGSRSLLLVSLKEILKKMGIQVEKPQPLILATNADRKLLSFLSEEGLVGVNLKMKEGKVERMTSELSVDGKDVTNLLYKSSKLGGFVDFILKYENDKLQSTKILKKRKF